MPIKFWKMHGAGNDFIVVPDMDGRFPAHVGACIRNLCARHDGIGADGLILLRPARAAACVQMLFFNPDGASAAMCGNGARCAARLAADLGLTPARLTLATGAGLVRAEILDGGAVRIAMPPPGAWKLRQKLNADGRRLVCHCVNTGVPHVVLVAPQLARRNVKKSGAVIRYHPRFAPAGTNVDFMSVDGAGVVCVRTYERGVEAETPACGTGITACALIAGKLGLARPPVTVLCAHGDCLTVDYRLTTHGARAVTLTGPAQYVFEGRIDIARPETMAPVSVSFRAG